MDMPVKLTSPRVWRTYRGGSQIDRIHGLSGTEDSLFPEEWILSTVIARNAGREAIPDEGLCRLQKDGTALSDFIAADPAAVLGAAHAEKAGASPGVLVKIIDAAERLTIQVHPDKDAARRLFRSDYGKTECWHILGGRSIDGEQPCIYMGFRENITRAYWEKVFAEQDIPAMLGCLHRFPVQTGETYLIRGGVPHAIGAGCLLIEIQEPTDYTIRTEKVTPSGLQIADSLCHQGLGFQKMFDCFHYDGCSSEEACRRWCIPPKVLEQSPQARRTEVIGYDRTPCFRLVRYDVAGSCTLQPRGVFSGLYVFSGRGMLTCGGQREAFAAGEQFLIPAGCSDFSVACDDPACPLILFQCFGPDNGSNGAAV